MPFNSYQEWRDTIPWSSKQIADAMRLYVPVKDHNGFMAEKYRKWADHVESTGRVSSRALGVALPFLVTKCELCERKALYRLGSVGRCSKHRDVKDAGVERQRAFRNALSAEKQRAWDDRDKLMRAYQKHKALHRNASSKRYK